MSEFHCDISRYNPETDEHPWTQSYAVPERLRNSMVLDVLEHIKTEDPSLAFRRSCREGVCGSDGMNINGVNRLACTNRVSDLMGTKSRLTIRPLTGMPIIRDLVVDMSQFFENYARVKPWLINGQPAPAIERLQSPEDRAKLDGLYECINCACCTSGCPSWWWNPKQYIGPSGLLWAERFLQDSRDTAEDDRLSLFFSDPYALHRCRNIENCTYVCPRGLNPMAAIGSIRRRLTKRST